MSDASFKPGLYEHYKGGLYVALGLVTHHHTRKPMVVYVSCKYGTTNVRPLEGWDRDEDGWTDITVNDAGDEVPRFKYVGPPIEGGG